MKNHTATFGWETKFAPASFKKISTGGVFEGYASLFGKEDLGHDIILPGAFRGSLAKRGAAQIKMLFQHDPKEPVGVWSHIAEDAKGLFVRGRLNTEVARAREILSLMREGAIDGLSIGFHTLKGRTDPKTGIRKLREVDLWEISIVTFPMQQGARIHSVKHRGSARRLPTTREFECWLTRDAGLTRREARTVIGKGYRAITGRRDAAGLPQPEPAQLAAKIRQAVQIINP
jgi:HK97 family phage prohead protease